MAWYQSNNKLISFFLNIFIKIIFVFFILNFNIFIINSNVNCIPNNFYKNIGENLKEVHYNNQILICSKDLSDCETKLFYDNNYEYFCKVLDIGESINYGIPKYFELRGDKIYNFSKFSPLSHFHWNLRYYNNIYLNFLFTHTPPYNDFSFISEKNLFGNRKTQYISNFFHIYSNNFIPKYYNLNHLKYNVEKFNQIDIDRLNKIEEYINKYNEELLEHLLKAFNFYNKN